jgi:hypothetical protein
MPQFQSDADFEIEQAKLARFLAGNVRDLDIFSNAQHEACYRRARVMLKAGKLMEACEFALTTLSGLSSEEFVAGGDALAREMLLAAITEANEYGLDSQRLASACREGVRDSIRNNRANTL